MAKPGEGHMSIKHRYLVNPYSLPKIFVGSSDIKILEEEDKALASFNYAELNVTLIIPRLYDDGHIVHNGVSRIPMFHFIGGILVDPVQYAEMRLARAVGDFNMNRLKFGYDIRPSMFQSMLDMSINTEPLGYGNALYRAVMKDRVLVHSEKNLAPSQDYDFRVGIQSIKILDTLATSMGDKIGLVNFLVDNNNDPSNSRRLSKVSRKIPFIEHTNLGRIPIIVSNMLHATDLVHSELPLITTADTGHIPDPPGLNVRVAFFSIAETFEDTIVVSRSVAGKFCCFKRKSLMWHNTSSLVKPGEIVEHGQQLCTYAGAYSENECKAHFYDANTFAFVDKVSEIEKPYMNSIHKVVSIELFIAYKLEDGDKLSNRSGQKGTVKIMPDDWMPVDDLGRRIDMIINPFSIYKGPDKGRRNYGQLIEAVLSHRIAPGKRLFVRQFTGEYSISKIAEIDCPKVFHKGQEIDCINGLVFMTRQNNHAVDSLSATGPARVMSPDLREMSGVRLGLADIMILSTLYDVPDVLMYMSKYVTGLEALSEYAKILPPKYKEAAIARNQIND